MKFKITRETKAGNAGKITGKDRAYRIWILLIILTTNLSACANSDTQNRDMQDSSEVTDDAAGSEAPATAENAISAPETYEDYMKLAADSYAEQDWETALAGYQSAKELDENREEVYRGMSDVYLQMDDVIQALAVLDEGIVKGDMEALILRKEYLLANVVAIRTKTTEYRYDDNGSILSGEIIERDRNGNEIKDTKYRDGGELSWVAKSEYDAAGNQISRTSIRYESDGNGSESYGWERSYDENGNETECVNYDKNGDIESRSVYEYDESGKQTKHTEYEEDGRVKSKIQTEYDSYGNVISEIYDTKSIKREYDGQGNEIKVEHYDDAGKLTAKILKEYDASNNQTGYAEYDAAGNSVEKWEREYDMNGNETKYVHYDGVSVDDSWERECDKNGNEIKRIGYDSDGSISYIWEYEYNENGTAVKFERIIFGDDEAEDVCEWAYGYDEAGREIEYETIFHDNNGNISFYHKREYEYNDYGKPIRYYEITENPEGSDGYAWDRVYDENGNEVMFSFYDDKEVLSYRSMTEYNENDLKVRYTGYDADGNILTVQETEYDTYGNIVRENYYDADEKLLWYYEKEYDVFGRITLLAMYENGILKSEEKTEYTYLYIGDIKADAFDFAQTGMTTEAINSKQRECFMRFLQGQERIHYYNEYNCLGDGRIVDDTITNLIDFLYYDKVGVVAEYAFWDMTGDGIEELLIRCSSSLYVIQCDYGVLKVIQSAVGGNLGTYLISNGERTGICCDFGGHVGGNQEYYYFLDQNFFIKNGKNCIALGDYQDYNENGEEIRSYCIREADSFEWYDISEGEYYDIADAMMTLSDSVIGWKSLEERYD